MRRILVIATTAIGITCIAAPAFACGGLIGPRGSVNLLRTTTLAGYHDGIEHYVTSFTFTGQGGGKFGSIVPLPGVPSKVERGGSWTLQRLEREVNPPPEIARDGVFATALSAPKAARVLLETRIDALDITVLEGGGAEVGTWAADNGFELPPDAPQVLDFYASRSQIFMAARFNLAAAQARGTQAGDGTPIHVTIPTRNPWVPLRILSLGKIGTEQIQADVFLLTDATPTLLPSPQNVGSGSLPRAEGLVQAQSSEATASLLSDLHNDEGMSWVPESDMHLTYLKLDAPASTLGYDLAIDATGAGRPSWRDAGFLGLRDAAAKGSGALVVAAIVLLALAAVASVLLPRRAFAS